MTRLAFFAAAFVTGIVLGSVAIIGVAQVAPEAAAPPIRTLDSCACGGSGNTVIACQSWPSGSGWQGYFVYRRYDGFVWSSWWTASYNLC